MRETATVPTAGAGCQVKKFISNLVDKLHKIDSDNITDQPEQINRQINSQFQLSRKWDLKHQLSH